MKRFTFSVVVTAVLGLAAYSFAGAQSDWRRPAFGGPGWSFQDEQRTGGPGRGFGFRGGGPMFGLRGIELTDDQKAEIKAIYDEATQATGGDAGNADSANRRRGRGPGGGADAALHRQLQAEVFADAPDVQKIETLQQQLIQAHSTRMARQTALQQKIAQVLTAEQRAQVRERLAGDRQPGGRRP